MNLSLHSVLHMKQRLETQTQTEAHRIHTHFQRQITHLHSVYFVVIVTGFQTSCVNVHRYLEVKYQCFSEILVLWLLIKTM